MGRWSSVELLRILSMFLVVILHFNHWGINPDILEMEGNLTVGNSIGHLFESISIVAVNVFILISGYFGIHFKVRGVLKLFLMCFCWGLISYLLWCVCGHHPIGKSLLARVLAFTQNKWWFIIAYLYLYFASPLLNVAIDHLDRKKYLLVLFLYAFSTLYIGYVRNMGDNDIGMSFAQFVLLYLIGRFINRHYPLDVLRKNRPRLVLGWTICTAITFGLAILNQGWLHLRIDFLRPYVYNSPWVIGASVCLLCIFLSFSFKSKLVNTVSGSVLSAYLLQESCYWGHQCLYPAAPSIFGTSGLFLKYFLLLLVSFLFLCACVLVDLLLKKAVYEPVLRFYDKKLLSKEKELISF